MRCWLELTPTAAAHHGGEHKLAPKRVLVHCNRLIVDTGCKPFNLVENGTIRDRDKNAFLFTETKTVHFFNLVTHGTINYSSHTLQPASVQKEFRIPGAGRFFIRWTKPNFVF